MPDQMPALAYSFLGPEILAASTYREISLAKRPPFLSSLGISPASLNLPKQVHQDTIVYCDGKTVVGETILADGLITDKPQVPLGIQTADCLPVFFWNPVDRVIGLAHAGWRGIQAGIIPWMIETFRFRFRSCACDFKVVLGPAIRSCCYEVGPEFETYFPVRYQPPLQGKQGCMDLSGEVLDQLSAAGVLEKNIYDSKLCTVCESQRFFSFRREKTDERILSVLQIR